MPIRISTSAWRGLLVAFCLVFLAQEAGTIPLTLNSVGVIGVTMSRGSTPFDWRVEVAPRSPAYRAGLRSGDVLDAGGLSPAERFRLWSGYWKMGEPAQLLVQRHGRNRELFVMPQHVQFDWALWLAIAAGFWSGLCALILVWRKPESWELRLIVVWLLTVRLSIQMGSPNWVTSSAPADAVDDVLASLMLLGWALLATYAASLPDRPDPFVRVFKTVAYALALFTAGVQALAVVAAWYGFMDPLGGLFTAKTSLLLQTAYLIVPVLCACTALTRSSGAARARFAWVFGSVVVYYLIGIAYFIPPQLFPALQASVAQELFLVLQLLAPIGLTYAMLNRRLLDIGFVLNRAAVYAGVSIVVIGIFVLVEWALSAWFSSATHVENLALSAVSALALGFSIRAIHQRIDLLLDNVFFRRRHEDEQAIRRFAREAPYITNVEILIERAINVLAEHTGASIVTIAVDDERGKFGSVDENDEAIISLRASHRPLDLGEVNSAFPGEFAFPMVARGRLVGALVLGAKRSGESYAPDETAAIEQAAHAIGGALDYLSARDDAHRDDLIAEMRSLQTALHQATEQFKTASFENR